MQSSNVVTITKDLQASNQDLENLLKTYPDIALIDDWLNKTIELIRIQQQSTNYSEPKPWFLYSPYMTLLSDEPEYAIDVMSKLCEAYSLELTNLPENSDIASACLKAFLQPQREPRVLLISDASVLSDDVEETYVEEIHSIMRDSSPQIPVLIVVISCTKQYLEISKSLRAVGRLDFRILLNAKSPLQHAQYFINLIPVELRDESLITHIEKLGKLISLNLDKDRNLKLIAVNLIRNAKATSTKISFKDVVKLCHSSTTKSCYPELPPSILEQVAVHECGHAVIAMLATQGDNIPEYITINESINYAGTVVNSYDYQYLTSNKPCYKDLLNTIRTLLAGRAATILYFDMMEYRYGGEYGDFQKANGIARNLVEDYCLVPPKDSNNDQYTICNLRGKESPNYIDRINSQVEQLLDYEYGLVSKTLTQHKALLQQLTETLLVEKELFQDDLKEIWAIYSEKVNLNKVEQNKLVFLA
jgi:hypothetical protein